MDSVGDNPESRKEFAFNRLKNRLESFQDWPHENTNCTSAKMAAAGFIHCPTKNEPDAVRCYACHKELDGWEPGDNPWEEHKNHSKDCPFIKLNKDEDEMTVEEFLVLEGERQSRYLQRDLNAKIGKIREAMKTVENLIREHISN